jgi:hypothetical protein
MSKETSMGLSINTFSINKFTEKKKNYQILRYKHINLLIICITWVSSTCIGYATFLCLEISTIELPRSLFYYLGPQFEGLSIWEVRGILIELF